MDIPRAAAYGIFSRPLFSYLVVELSELAHFAGCLCSFLRSVEIAYKYTATWAKIASPRLCLHERAKKRFTSHKFNSRNQQKPIIKMKSVIIASLIASAAAFAPAQQAAKTTAMSMSFEDELGAQAPLGFFDPLGMVSDGDQDKFDRLRYVEIKHGRISMLAVVGYLVAENGIRLPGDIDYSGTTFASIPNGFGALDAISGAGIAQIVAFIGFLEVAVMKDITGGEFVGDFRNGAFDLGWDTFDAETQLSKRAIELNQGRAAQMGILALMVHEKLGVSLIPN